MTSTLALAEAQARQAGARAIHTLRMRIGELSGVVPEALQFAFETLRAGTLAESAALTIESVPAACWCGACQREFESADLAALGLCPHCGQASAALLRGRELELSSLEIS